MGQLVEGERKTQLIAGYVEPSLHEQLVALARQQERTVSAVVRRALLRELRECSYWQAMVGPSILITVTSPLAFIVVCMTLVTGVRQRAESSGVLSRRSSRCGRRRCSSQFVPGDH
jgi:hypothetical protein